MYQERMLTVGEAAARLRADEQTVRRWLRSGKLPGHMIGGTKLGYRIPESAVERLLSGRSAVPARTSALRSDAERRGLDDIAAGLAERTREAPLERSEG